MSRTSDLTLLLSPRRGNRKSEEPTDDCPKGTIAPSPTARMNSCQRTSLWPFLCTVRGSTHSVLWGWTSTDPVGFQRISVRALGQLNWHEYFLQSTKWSQQRQIFPVMRAS